MEIISLVKNGHLPLELVMKMTALERRIWFYGIAKLEGYKINWDTGALVSPYDK